MQGHVQNAVAVLAVAGAIAMLAWTAVAKNRPLIAEPPALMVVGG